ncbi:MAG: hypothetical protein KGL39_29795 [Patescibacteria group bacterium]|nr:hypothetical protein [Patescibacteria group bacterium]
MSWRMLSALRNPAKGGQMKYVTVESGIDAALYFEGDESTALYVAVRRTALKGVNHEVQDARSRDTIWYVEADTKVGDEPTFPAIVHARGEGWT